MQFPPEIFHENKSHTVKPIRALKQPLSRKNSLELEKDPLDQYEPNRYLTTIKPSSSGTTSLLAIPNSIH